MIQPEFLYRLKQLPAETPLTASHVIAILDTVSALLEKNSSVDYDSLPNSKLISEDALAQWLDESNSTLQKWRVKGGGPNYVRGPKSVRYSVGSIRDWIESRTVKSTNEAYAKGLSKLEVLNGENKISPSIISYPLMIADNSHVDFFISIEDELQIDGHSIISLKNDSALKPSVLDVETRENAGEILRALDDFNKAIIKNPKKAHQIYGNWQSQITLSQRLGYFSTALIFDLDLAEEIGLEFTDEFLGKSFNPTQWVMYILTNHNLKAIEALDLDWSFKYIASRGIDINTPYQCEDKIGNVIFKGTIAHLLANLNNQYYQIKNFHDNVPVLGSLLNELLSLGLNVDLKNETKENLSAREMAQQISARSKTPTTFLSTIMKRELYEKLTKLK